MKQMLYGIKDHTGSDTTAGVLNSLFSYLDRSSELKQRNFRAKIYYGSTRLDNRKFKPTDREYTFFSVALGMVSKINHIIAHKSSFNNNIIIIIE